MNFLSILLEIKLVELHVLLFTKQLNLYYNLY